MPKLIWKPRKTLTSYLAVLVVTVYLTIAAFPALAEEVNSPPAQRDFTTPVTPSGGPGAKDPFKPFIDTGVDVTKQKAKATPISPLQRQDISMFTVVGITGSDRDGWKAVVEDGEKKFYVLKEGMLIGLGEGRVSQIRADRVVVAVKDPDVRGRVNHITMRLHKDTVEEAP